MKEYTITPINTGMVNSNKANYLYHNSTHKYYDVEGNIQLPVTVFLVQSEDRKILIDTGMSSTEIANKYHHPGSVQPEGYAIYEQLEKMGLSKFQQLARDAGACYKLGQMVLVNLDILDEYLETFRIVDSDYYVSTGDIDSTAVNGIKDDLFQGNEDAYYLTENAFAFAASAMIPIGQASTAGNLTFKSTATIVAKEGINRKIALHRFGEIKDVADMAYSILTNNYMNGSIVDIHGGYDYF